MNKNIRKLSKSSFMKKPLPIGVTSMSPKGSLFHKWKDVSEYDTK